MKRCVNCEGWGDAHLPGCPLDRQLFRADVRYGDELTYRGSDGARHYLRVKWVNADGSLVVSRGYYGDSVIRLRPEDHPEYFKTGQPVRLVQEV